MNWVKIEPGYQPPLIGKQVLVTGGGIFFCAWHDGKKFIVEGDLYVEPLTHFAEVELPQERQS